MSEIILSVKDLKTYFYTASGVAKAGIRVGEKCNFQLHYPAAAAKNGADCGRLHPV